MRELIIQQNDLISLSDQILHKGGALSFKAYGSSMTPFIRSGDVISVEPVSENSLTIGTIVLCKSNQSKIVAHRVVKRHVKNGQIFLSLRGDALLRPDQTVTIDQVMGKITGIQRGQQVIRFNRRLWPLTSSLWRRSHPIGPLLLKTISALKQLSSPLNNGGNR